MKKVLAVGGAVAALVAGPIGAAPVAAQTELVLDLPCEIFKDPYGYPCQTAEDTYHFAVGEAGDAIDFALGLRDEAGEAVFRVYCIAFPNQPECQ